MDALNVLQTSGGAYRLGRRPRLRLLVGAAGEAGWRVVVLDGLSITTKAQLLANVAHSLAFPSWFGNNWDALSDCLGDINQQAVAQEMRGLCLIWNAASVLAAVDPESVRTFAEICGELASSASGPLLLVRSHDAIEGIATP
jgi:hypothetical protein